MIEKLSDDNSFEIEFAKNLLSLECLASKEQLSYKEEEFIAAICACWNLVQEYNADTKDILNIDFISTLHKTLAIQIGAHNPGEFVDDGGMGASWSDFKEQIKDTIEEFEACENCYIIAQLFWGGHLPNLQISVGWLCVNTLALRYGYSLPSYPSKSIYEEFIECLEDAGPDCWDAENLRALIG
jgi:hypothetical protein